MVGNGIQRSRDDNGARLLVVQHDGLLIFEGSRHPIVDEYIELGLGLAWSLYHLLIGQRRVLVERHILAEIGGGSQPAVAITLFSIFLQILRFYNLRRKCSGSHT